MNWEKTGEKKEKQGRIRQEKFYCGSSTARHFGNNSGTGTGYKEAAGLAQMLLLLWHLFKGDISYSLIEARYCQTRNTVTTLTARKRTIRATHQDLLLFPVLRSSSSRGGWGSAQGCYETPGDLRGKRCPEKSPSWNRTSPSHLNLEPCQACPCWDPIPAPSS